jgi:hypothetical protein
MNRKATFAKRQREMDLKDHAKQKEARRVERTTRSATPGQKGPAIAWDEQVQVVITPDNSDGTSLVPNDDSAVSSGSSSPAPTSND